MVNPDRHNSNMNNEYIETFQDIVRNSQSEGYYNASWESGYAHWSEREHKKIEVAAQVVCNRKEFKGLSYEIDFNTYDDHDDDFYEIIIKFTWS